MATMDATGQLNNLVAMDDPETRQGEFLIAKPRLQPQESLASSFDNEKTSEEANGRPSFNSERINSESSLKKAAYLLDKYLEAGILQPLTVTDLKFKFMDLISKYESTKKNEKALLYHLKDQMVENSSLEKCLKRADNYPEGFTGKVDALRAELLTAGNRVLEIEERLDDMKYTTASLEEEKIMLSREAARYPSQEEVEKRRRMLEREIDELTADVQKGQFEGRRLRSSLREAEEELSAEGGKLTSLQNDLDALRTQREREKSSPLDIMQTNARLNEKTEEGKRLLKAVQDELEQATRERLELLQLQSQVEVETTNLASQSMKQQAKLIGCQGQLEGTKRLIAEKVAVEGELRADRARMELDIQHLQQDKNHTLELNAKQTKERDRELRLVRQATNNLKILQDTVNFLEKTQASLKQEMELQKACENTGSLKVRSQLSKDIAQLTMRIASETEASGTDQAKIQELMTDQERLFSEMLEERKQAISLCRLVCLKSEETVQKQRYLKTAKAHFAQVVSDMKVQDMALVEPRKRLRMLEVQLRDFSKLYDAINMDRNKCLNLISLARQRKLELREKTRLYENELELIKSGLAHKEYQLHVLMTKHSKASEQCTTLRNDISKVKNSNLELTTQIDRVATTVHHLEKIKTQTEADIQLLDKSYEKMVRLRNDRSTQLIERNEEVCALQENLRLLEEQARRAEEQLAAREEELTALQLVKKEQLRALEAARGQLGHRRAVENELVDLQVKMALTAERLEELETLAEDPNAPLLDPKTGRAILPPLPAQQKFLAIRSKEDAAAASKDLAHSEVAVEPSKPAGRVRLLEGSDLSVQQITEKIEELEVKITKKEALLLERKMILEATERLVDDLKEQAVVGNEVTLQLAVHVNRQQASSQKLSRQMKALASELTLRMIECAKLDSKAKALIDRVDVAKQRISAEEPPTDDAEEEFQRLQRRHKVEQEVLENVRTQRLRRELEDCVENDGTWTAAEMRPNAYLADGLQITAAVATGLLPPPTPDYSRLETRPFGAFAPVKPGIPSSNMRHIRQPNPKPVEI
nr:unnamed protein product [Spirometra erinaceieuropaei]